MKKLLASILTLTTLPLAVGAQAACQDDERLYAIGDFLEAQQNGSPAPLELTAATYLNLTPKARDAIGDNLVILDASCNAMQVSEGEPPVRIEMPFPVLYSGYYDAVLRGDEQTANILLHSFTAEPVDPEGFLSLLTVITRNAALTERLANSAGMPPHKAVGNRCKEDTSYLTFADLFVRFGGKVEGPHGKAWFAAGSKREITSADAGVTHSYAWLSKQCAMSKQPTLATARSAGAIVVDMGNSVADYWGNNAGKRVRDTYNKWVEAGAPDEGPQSLFE